MAKAHLTTKAGTTIVIEGTPNEVAEVMKQLEGRAAGVRMRSSKVKGRSRINPAQQKPTPINLISSLIDGGFFKKPKDLGSVKVALEEMGHHYPVTTLSPAMLRLVRGRQLRRIRDKKRWMYTG